MIGVPLPVAPFVTGRAMFANPARTRVFVIAGLVLAVTALVRFCPAYSVFNLSTSEKDDKRVTPPVERRALPRRPGCARGGGG